MCSVGFNSNKFGMNIKPYQNTQQTRFGMGVRSTGYSQLYNNDRGIFTAGKPNVFAANAHSLTFNGVKYDNQYSMLNTVGSNDKAAGTDKSFNDIFKEVLNALNDLFETIGDDFGNVGDTFKSLFGGKSKETKNNPDLGKKSLDDIQNAQDKQSLNQALDGANQDNSQIQSNLTGDTNALRAAQGQETQAQQNVDSSQENLSQANSDLSKAQQDLNAAQAEVQTAEQGLQTAKGNVSTAQQALDAARAAATPENPNDAAIREAESNLAKAQQEEQAAQQKLDAAKQKETQAQEAVSNAEQQVNTAEQDNTEAQSKLDQASNNVASSEENLQATETRGEEIEQGIKDGEQKMQQLETQMQEQVYGTDTNPPTVSEELTAQRDEQVFGTDTEPQTIERENMFSDQDNLIESKGYNDEQKAEILKARQDVQNLQPGQTVQCGADTYTMDENGTIHVNDTAGEYKNKDEAAMNAGDSAMRGIDSKKQSDAEIAALRGGDKPKAKPSVSDNSKPTAAADTPAETKETTGSEDKPVKDLDTSKPGTEWRGKRVGAGMKEDVKLVRNDDGTITETGISGKRILDADGKKVLYVESKHIGFRGGTAAIDYRTGTETTELDSITSSMSPGYMIGSSMSKPGTGGEIHDKDGNLLLKMKDGEFFNAKGKKIKLEKAIDLINDNKGEGLKLVRQLQKKDI